MNFVWKAIEKMGCLFSKRKKKGNAYLYKGDENDSSTANNGDSNGNTTVSSSGGFGSGGFGSGGGAVSGGVKVCIIMYCFPVLNHTVLNQMKSSLRDWLMKIILKNAYYLLVRMYMFANLYDVSLLRSTHGMNVRNLIQRILCL